MACPDMSGSLLPTVSKKYVLGHAALYTPVADPACRGWWTDD